MAELKKNTELLTLEKEVGARCDTATCPSKIEFENKVSII